MTYTDAAGRQWTIQDYRVIGKAKKPVPFGTHDAAGRAFVPDGWDGPVMLYQWGVHRLSHRDCGQVSRGPTALHQAVDGHPGRANATEGLDRSRRGSRSRTGSRVRPRMGMHGDDCKNGSSVAYHAPLRTASHESVCKRHERRGASRGHPRMTEGGNGLGARTREYVQWSEDPGTRTLDGEQGCWTVREVADTIDGGRGGKSLVFESDSVMRRVRTYPRSWFLLSDAELYALSLDG